VDVIIPATTSEHYREFGTMIREYVDWCRASYAGDDWLIDAVFGHQSLEAELQKLSSSYATPSGRAFLARSDNEMVGCIAYRRLSETICEMKRLFVRKAGQGRGMGRRLCMASIDAARNDGYTLMRLDTVSSLMTEAIALYRSIGFRDCSAYNTYPDDLAPHIVFMDLPLGSAKTLKTRVDDD
jgi:GNAT superfamily N-acetyltransferase